jgi:hypothetical protein
MIRATGIADLSPPRCKMNAKPTNTIARSTLADTLVADLTADAVRRWGEEHASLLVAAIASTAETLALVATVSLAHDDAEPDAGFKG